MEIFLIPQTIFSLGKELTEIIDEILERAEREKVFREAERHKCFVCYEYFSPNDTKVCPVCGWLICPNCNGCLCSLGEEAQKAVLALFETFCTNCRFRSHGSPKSPSG